MTSFRDRFFTPGVARTMMSPSAIAATVGGAGVGGLAGSVVGSAAMVIGGILGAAVGWTARVGTAVPKAPARKRIDPFTLAEPWRRLVQNAVAARKQFDDAVKRAKDGPIQERLASIGVRINDAVDDAWETARAGNELASAYSRVDAKGAQRQLDKLRAADNGAGGSAESSASITSITSAATAEALESRVATALRMAAMITTTEDQLRLLNARLDESVTRCIELSVGAYQPDEFNAVEGAVGSITDELEALRSALADTAS